MSNLAQSQLYIVLVEDNEGHARLIQKNLQRANIANPFIHFSDGQEAIDYFDQDVHLSRRHLILLDLNLPKVQGVDVLKRLRGSERTRSIPVIILTSSDDPKEIEACYKLGCNIYVTKPVEYEAFIEAIRRLGLFLSIIRIPDT